MTTGDSRRPRPLRAPEPGSVALLEPGPMPDPGRPNRHAGRDPDPARLAFARPEGANIGPPSTSETIRNAFAAAKGGPPREVVVGLVGLAVGTALLLGWGIHPSWTPILDLSLVAVGVVLVVQARRRRVSRPLIALGVLLAVIAAATWRADVTLDGGLGDRTVVPESATSQYRLGTGQLTVDLTDVAAAERTIDAEVGIGRLVVVVPEGTGAVVHAVAGGGATLIDGRHHVGPGRDELLLLAGTPGTPVVTLELRVGLGTVEVRRG